jgi:hypothetical protein
VSHEDTKQHEIPTWIRFVAFVAFIGAVTAL